MTALTIQDVSRRSGLSGPTLRYYEEVWLIGPVERDASSRHRRYREEDLDRSRPILETAPRPLPMRQRVHCGALLKRRRRHPHVATMPFSGV